MACLPGNESLRIRHKPGRMTLWLTL